MFHSELHSKSEKGSSVNHTCHELFKFLKVIEILVTNSTKADNLYVLSPTQSTPIASHQQAVQTNQMAFCWSGKKVFLTTGEGRIKILSYPDFRPILHTSYDPSTPFTLNGHTSSCLSIEMQPTARFLATGGVCISRSHSQIWPVPTFQLY